MKYFREMMVQALKGFQGLSSHKLLNIIVLTEWTYNRGNFKVTTSNYYCYLKHFTLYKSHFTLNQNMDSLSVFNRLIISNCQKGHIVSHELIDS